MFLIAPCCLFTAAIIAWAATALGALKFEAQSALMIWFIACVLIVVVHIAPDSVGLALAAAVAAHAALVAADFAGVQRRPAARLQGEQR